MILKLNDILLILTHAHAGNMKVFMFKIMIVHFKIF